MWTIEDHVRGKPELPVKLFHEFVAIIRELGPFSTSVTKTTVTFKGTRRGFAGARPTKRGIRGYLDLQRAVEDVRIHGASPYTKRLFVNHYLISSPDELDEVFKEWVREAYEVGNGKHLRSPE